MNVIKTGIDDLLIIEPQVFEDERGYFYESYNKREFEKHNLFYDFIQDNQSKSKYGTIRGLHFQIKPYAQAKLVRAINGRILDVAVDLRKDKKTFGKSFAIELSEENKKQLLVPRGFAHGFAVLSETAVVSYKIDNIYKPEFERSIIYNDLTLNIDWKIEKQDVIISEKDKLENIFSFDNIYF
ncbi:MAG: dTDP-4-dehydrorhamnose 3,5-epimerase [Chlorobi bacterium]|nr:dTDP-4-dehydrorhamnose 3,5-epimerase [Chlorobiota bacterium]